MATTSTMEIAVEDGRAPAKVPKQNSGGGLGNVGTVALMATAAIGLLGLVFGAVAFSKWPGVQTDPISAPIPDSARRSIGEATAEHRQKIIEGVKKMKATPSPWSSGFHTRGPLAGQPVPARWHNLSWYDTLVTLHATQALENSFGHMGPVFAPWHRIFLDMYEEGLNEVMGNPDPPLKQPFWDWTDPTQSTLLLKDVGGDGFGDCVKSGPYAWPQYNISVGVTLFEKGTEQQCLVRYFAGFGAAVPPASEFELGSVLPSASSVHNTLQVLRYDAFPFDASALGGFSFRNVLEGFAGADNQGNKPGVSFHQTHNEVHLWAGGTMADVASPNDPMFFYHHSNVDRLYQTWLTRNAAVYGSDNEPGITTFNGYSGYPARIKKVYDAECATSYPALKVEARRVPGSGMVLSFSGAGSELESVQAVIGCVVRQFPGSPKTADLAGRDALGHLLTLIGWPADNAYAAPKLSAGQIFMDPVSQTADAQAGTSGWSNSLTYEAFQLTSDSVDVPSSGGAQRAHALSVNTFHRQTQVFLLQPDWLEVNAPGPSGRPKPCRTVSFGVERTNSLCTYQRAVVTDVVGQKVNMSGFSPGHYWMPGYFEQMKNIPVNAVYLDGYSVPRVTCTGGNCKNTNEVDLFTGQEMVATPANSTGYSQIWFDTVECLSAAGLSTAGYVAAGKTVDAAMAPPSHDFCVVTFHIEDNSLLSAAENAARNAQRMSVMPAMTFVGSEFIRPTSAPLPDVIDITSNIYVGARPGHNLEDLMMPFEQLGYNSRPSDYFSTTTAQYSHLYPI